MDETQLPAHVLAGFLDVVPDGNHRSAIGANEQFPSFGGVEPVNFPRTPAGYTR